jgi:hypothetical protein
MPSSFVQDKCELWAMRLREAAETLPDGDEREDLLFRARRMDRVSIILDRWTP